MIQNMLSKGNAKAQAESETMLLLELLKYLGHATMTASDHADAVVLKMNFVLDAKCEPRNLLACVAYALACQLVG